MSEAKPLLIELGCEELPPQALDELSAAFARGIGEGFAKCGVMLPPASTHVYNSPRRLAVLIDGVPAAQPDQDIERRGPALNAALDATGQPTKALSGFAASCGVAVDKLEKLETDKGSWFVFRSRQPGQKISSLIPELIEAAIKQLPIPRPMRWGSHDFAFVRPLHWLVVLHGSDVVDAQIFGIRSGRESRGHRFHHPQPVQLFDPLEYVDKLKSAMVLVDPEQRRDTIRAQVESTARKLGGSAHLRRTLLDEIANLTEWPQAIGCSFDAAFLEVPQEALIQTMETNQKFVPIFDSNAKLSEHFVGVANIASSNVGEIRRGYERVIRPRFADAKFFYDEDLKTPLADYQRSLESVTYQQQLGSVWDKSLRVADLARVIANRTGVDAALATRAAALSKCDLMTRMVGEFPELQGVMGRTYASRGANPESDDVAMALDEFYRPRFAGDAIAGGKIGQVLSIAERIDTLAGIFAVGMKPSGNKDPFALRRAGLGLARTLIEGGIELDLPAQFAEALALLPAVAFSAPASKAKGAAPAQLDLNARRAELGEELYAFVLDRLRGYYLEQSIPAEVFESVRVLAPSSLLDFDRRLRAVVGFAKLAQAQSLAAANKRIGNILKQAEVGGAAEVDTALLEAGAESDLYRAVAVAEASIAPLIAESAYVEILTELSGLREAVDRFFDSVMVMTDDPARRRNRLALLGRMRRMFLEVADISMLPGA